MGMNEATTKAQLIQQMKEARAALEAVIASIPETRMTEGGVVEGWSVKDMLAHLAVWQARTVTMLFQAERGQKPSLGVSSDSANDWANVNAKDYQEQKDRPLDRVLADFRGVHGQMLKRLEQWKDDAALFDRKRYPSLNGDSLANYIYGNGPEHDDEHRVQIEAWLKR